jgi:lysophospholipase L1-like esterase
MVKILALGDSYTAGQAVKTEERFTFQLARLLKQHGAPEASITTIAKGGWKADTLKGALDQALPGLNVIDPEYGKVKYEYDLVTLLVGVNDLTVGNPRDTFCEQYDILIRRALFLTRGNAGRVLVLSLPAYGHSPDAHNPQTLKARGQCGMVKRHMQAIKGYNTPGGIKATVERYNAALHNLVRRHNRAHPKGNQIQWVDIHTLTRVLPSMKHESGSDMHLPEYFDKQGVHYKPEMYKTWAEAMLPYALSALRNHPAPQGILMH